MFNERYDLEIDIQKKKGLYREPISILGREAALLKTTQGVLINFSSNDYLGLSQDSSLESKLITSIKKYGRASSSSRLLTGNSRVLEEAEKVYAQYFGYEDALFFPSGYQANLALVSTLFNNTDTIIYDKKVHASIVMGLKVTDAELKGFNHNSMMHLEKRLFSTQESSTVITESLFSMDGDLLPVSDIKRLKDNYKFNLIVDEAHSFGVLGDRGRGLSTQIADIAVGTLGKAFGFNGAFVLMPGRIKEYFINFSSPLIYTTALPPYFGSYVQDILYRIEEMDNQRAYVCDLSSYTKASLINEGLKVTGDAHILSIFIGDENRAVAVSNQLRDRGILLTTSRYPTVPMGKAILRIGINTLLTRDHIDKLIKSLKEILSE